ncbi:MAG: heme ABC transporter ATP-binding protein [Chloroflexi bacterium]|nr:heme ABC transporter ATP-binding protein [Chloroflexota bacterium]
MLSIERLAFSYGDKTIIDGLDLEVRPGELVGIVGPNGTGKSTLLRLISGVLKADSGVIRLKGKHQADLKAKERALLVSVVPQNPSMPLGFRVIDVVLMGRNAHLSLLQWESRRDLDVAKEALELTDTLDLADRVIDTLSGGERQRVLIAMALAQESPIMLLDEPTSSLDLSYQTGIMDLVTAVQRRRDGVVIVAMHDLTLAAQYCDRLVMLSNGRIYAEGPPQDVLTVENIARVYGADVAVIPHPESGSPVVLPIRGAAFAIREGEKSGSVE